MSIKKYFLKFSTNIFIPFNLLGICGSAENSKFAYNLEVNMTENFGIKKYILIEIK